MIRHVSRFFANMIINYIQQPISNYQSYQFIPLAELEAQMRLASVWKALQPLTTASAVSGGKLEMQH